MNVISAVILFFQNLIPCGWHVMWLLCYDCIYLFWRV